ncbi:MAG: TIGR01620 family protein [Pseudomonadota bacterium]
MGRKPVLIALDDAAVPAVTDAPPVPETDPVLRQTAAMQTAMRAQARAPSRLARWGWALTGALLVAVISTAAWDFVTAWIARQPVVGWTLAALTGAVVLVLLALAAREWAALRRLARVDGIRRAAEEARDLATADGVVARLEALYRDREEVEWGRARLAELRGDQLDADALLGLAEGTLLEPLDTLAAREVEAAARQVATVTALVPLALADVAAALLANVRMIRRVAEIYGGRGGILGSWRLTRAVMAHLVATGAVAVGDDLLEPVLGGSILGKLSRRFGEGLVNGALTARVGAAAIEVCRPLPFVARERPRARTLVKQALGGMFQTKS